MPESIRGLFGHQSIACYHYTTKDERKLEAQEFF